MVPGGSLPTNHRSCPRRACAWHPGRCCLLRSGCGRSRQQLPDSRVGTSSRSDRDLGQPAPRAARRRELSERCSPTAAPRRPAEADEERLTLIFRDFFSSLMTVSLSSSFSPSPSASVISARRAAARSSAGGVGCNRPEEKDLNSGVLRGIPVIANGPHGKQGTVLGPPVSAGLCHPSPGLCPPLAPRGLL